MPLFGRPDWIFFCSLISDSNEQFPFEAPPPQPEPHPQEPVGGAGSEGAGLESHSSEMLHQLQSNQLSVRQFCSSVATFVTPLIVGYLSRDFPWVTATPTHPQGGANERRQVLPPCRTVAVCVCVCLQLLECVVELMECEAVSSRLIQQEDDKIVRVSLYSIAMYVAVCCRLPYLVNLVLSQCIRLLKSGHLSSWDASHLSSRDTSLVRHLSSQIPL